MALDPTHIAATTSAIATVLFSKAIEKGGEHIGDAMYQKAGNMFSAVKEKFLQQGSIETLTEVQEDPSAENISQFTQELRNLMLEDDQFAADIENSLAIFSQDSEVQDLIAQVDSQADISDHQPLNVSQFEDEMTVEEKVEKPSLTIEDNLDNKKQKTE
ncbi:MAG: hypothetical protein WBB82_13715 [Limnothrix sp.]